MWFPLAALTADTCTSNTSIQLAASAAITSRPPPPPTASLSGSLIWLLQLVKQEIHGWAAGLAVELETYEARGPNNTRFQVFVAITVYVLVAFNLEFYEWGKQELLRPKQKSQRRGKRIKEEPKTEKLDNGFNANTEPLSTSSFRPLTPPNEQDIFFTPAGSPGSTEANIPEKELAHTPPRVSFAPLTEIGKPKSIIRNSSITHKSPDSILRKSPGNRQDQSIHFNNENHGLDESQSRVSFAQLPGVHQQLKSEDDEAPPAKPSPQRVSFASTPKINVDDEETQHEESPFDKPSPQRVSFASTPTKVNFDDDAIQHVDAGSEITSPPRVSFSPTPMARREQVFDEDLQLLDFSRTSMASLESATSSYRASFPKIDLESRHEMRTSPRPLSARFKSESLETSPIQQPPASNNILERVAHRYDGNRSGDRLPAQPFACGESSIESSLVESSLDSGIEESCDEGYSNRMCGIGQTSGEISLSSNSDHKDDAVESLLNNTVGTSKESKEDSKEASQKSEVDEFNESVRRVFGDHLVLNAKDYEAEPAINELEKIAIALKAGLTYRTIKNRMKKKTYKDCFSGSAAVDFLTQHLRKPRKDALQIGRKIAQEYNLFVKCGSKQKKKKKKKLKRGEKGMVDESAADFSQSMVDQSMHMDQSAASQGFEGDGKLKTSLLQDSRSIYYRLFAFLPSEVEGMPMVRKMRVFEEGVTVKKNRRRHGLKIKKHKQSFSGKDAVNFLLRCKLCASRQDGVALCNEFIKEFNLLEPVKFIDDTFQDSGKALYQFVDKKNRYFNIDDRFSTRLVEFQGNDFDWGSGDMSSNDGDNYDTTTLAQSKATFFDFDSSDSSSESDLEESELHELRPGDYQRLCEVAEILERGVALKKQGTFVASRAVTFMVTSGLAESRKQAELLGRRLEREFNLFYEITGKHDFSDSNHYFRFTDMHERHSSPLKVQVPLDEIAEAFEQGVKVKDYVHNLKTYKQSFVGTKAVDFLVNSRLARNRAEAVRIGRQLVEHFNLFEPRIKGGREFSDDYVYFRFTVPENRRVPDLDEKELIQFRTSTLERVKTAAEELQEITQWFLHGVKVKDNKFRAKYYRNTFVGTEAVSYMVNNSRAVSRKEAVELGRSLCSEVGLFKGIDGSTDFRDDYLLYRFEETFQHFQSEDQSTPQTGMVSGLKGISGVSAKSLPLEKIAKAFRENMEVSDYRGRRKVYENAFVGREAVDFIVGHGLAKDRVEAVGLGRAMAREFDLFEHIKKDHDFKDAKHHYQFCYEGEVRPLEDIELDKVRLSEIARAFVSSVKVKEHRKNLLVFKKTFVGTEAVDFLVRSYVASTRKEAVQIGRAITKEFNLFDHVTQDRKFEDSDALFFFQKEEEQYKGLMFERQHARRNVFGIGWDEVTSVSCDSNASLGLVSLGDEELANQFSLRVQKVLRPHIETIEDDDDSVEAFRKYFKNKFVVWASHFHRLDPRHQIQYYFEAVAQDGAMGMENRDFITANLKETRLFLPNRAQVFTVWRPTALHAIRKMMKGEGVGKGLDIKGKSAKRGKVAGFVPFLQIGDNKHKKKIRPPSKQSVVRIFYPAESRRGRDIAADVLERVGQEMIATVANARKVLLDKNASKDAKKDAMEAMQLDMSDPKILYVDDYAPQSFGLEVPERLFWEAYFNRTDCTRKPGSEYDTGRPSQPAFQDMNFATLRAQPKRDAPRACVFQHADAGEPMNPFELLMAYEEHSRVMPVVSDFDCFLVGTQSVTFSSPLPPDQLEVLSWSVSEIENVLATSIVGDSWTVRWLEVLKKAAREGIHPEIPQFGFGDPKSYAIMKSAVSHLKDTGAVRHGAECFNYYFPQDLDDEYLVIAHDLPGNKPWLYVDEAGLTNILSQKIDQGFTFPLNPKWVLCDSNRWYNLYQKLLRAENIDTQRSMDVWFPPDSGLREKIEKIHNSRPEGFYEEPLPSDDDGSLSLSLKSGRKSVAVRNGKKDHLMGMFAMGLLEKPKEVEEIDLGKSPKKSAMKRARKKMGKLVKGKSGKSRKGSVVSTVTAGGSDDEMPNQNGDGRKQK